MLKVFTMDGDEYRRMSLAELAELLRPLLVEQPAPADVPTRADLLAAVAAYQREVATLRSDLTHIEAANADLFHTMEQATRQRDEADVTAESLAAQLEEADTEIAGLRAQLDDTSTIVEQHKSQITTLLRAIEGMADSRDRMAAQVTESVQAIERLTAERDALSAKWAETPWAALGDIVATSAMSGLRWQLALRWLENNRPTEANG